MAIRALVTGEQARLIPERLDDVGMGAVLVEMAK